MSFKSGVRACCGDDSEAAVSEFDSRRREGERAIGGKRRAQQWSANGVAEFSTLGLRDRAGSELDLRVDS